MFPLIPHKVGLIIAAFSLILASGCTGPLDTTDTALQVSAPVFSLQGGQYLGDQTVTLACDTPEAVIFYTTDGSTPSLSQGMRYESPVVLTTQTVLKAVAVKTGYQASEVSTALYSLIQWKGGLATPPETPESGWAYYNTTDQVSYIYDGSQWQILVESGKDGMDGAPGVDGKDGEDGTDGTNGLSILWKGAFPEPPANPGINWAYYNTVLGKSFLYDGTAWTIIAQDGDTKKVGLPLIIPAGGTYSGPLTVALYCMTEGAVLRYTTDGTTPTLSQGTNYTAPFVLTYDTTLKVAGFKTGMTSSSVSTAVYVINTPSSEVMVTFDDGQGNKTKILAPRGGKVSEPAEPWMLGRTFEGWFLDQDGREPWIFQYFRVETDTTLYAKWTPIEKRDMISILGGTFTQSDGNTADDFTHTITGFKIGKYEVTYALWYNVWVWAIAHGYTFPVDIGSSCSAVPGQGLYSYQKSARPDEARYHPATQITWPEAVVWCNAYSEMMGYTPAYQVDGAVIRDTTAAALTTRTGLTMNMASNGYRLPTEGEWQYAATSRGTQSATLASGALDNTSAQVSLVAWFRDNSADRMHEVGTKLANSKNIHDMSGNVEEWCWDWYGSHTTDAKTDYTGPTTGTYGITKGMNYDNVNAGFYVGHKESTLVNNEAYTYFGKGLRVVKRN